MAGLGSVYKRGERYWIKYYDGYGNFQRESSHSISKMVADALLKKRLSQLIEGRIPNLQLEKVTFNDLISAFLRDYRINNHKSLDKAERSVHHLLGEPNRDTKAENRKEKKRCAFDGMLVVNLTTTKIQEYVDFRLDTEGALPATINRELAALKRILYLGAEQTPPLVNRALIPRIKMLKENNVRKGFFEHHDFIPFYNALPEYMKAPVLFAYKYGWRRSEIFNLPQKQVDLVQGIVRLEPGDTKNGEGRTIHVDKEMLEVLRAIADEKKKKGIISPYIFMNWNDTGTVKDFRGVWNKACREVGLEGMLFHDLRRTAIRNMIRAGVQTGVAMLISGHKTMSVLLRYNIISEVDVKGVPGMIEAYNQRLSEVYRCNTAQVIELPVNREQSVV